MKKAITLVLVLMMVLSLAACGGSAEPEAPAAPAEPAAEPAAQPEGGDAAATDWNDFADIFTVCFYGVTEGGETVAFVLNEDETMAALAVANTDTMESVSFVGTMEPATFEDGTNCL